MHTTYTPRPKFPSVFLYDETFMRYGPIRRTVHRMTPKWPGNIWDQNYPFSPSSIPLNLWVVFVGIQGCGHTRYVHTSYAHKAQTFISVSFYIEQFSNYNPLFFFEKSAPKCHKVWPRHVQGQNYTCMHTKSITRPPNYLSFRSTMSRFRVMVQFWELAQRVIQSDIEMISGQKYPYAYYVHLPNSKCSNVCPFALQWAAFELWPNFGKFSPNGRSITLKYLRSKVPMCSYCSHQVMGQFWQKLTEWRTCTLETQFSSIALYEPFSCYDPNGRNMHWVHDPQITLTCVR